MNTQIKPKKSDAVSFLSRPGPIPAQTTLEGDDGVISNLWMRYAQNGGAKKKNTSF
jgi:hypothetical protein